MEIKLTLELVNGILAYFGKQKYEDVFMLVQEIQKQATPQVQAVQPEAVEEAPPEVA